MAWVGNETEKDFSLDRVKWTAKLTKTIEIPPFSTKQVQGMTRVRGHNKKANLIVKPMKNKPSSSAVSVPSYTLLKPSSSTINMNVRSLTSRKITVKANLIVARVAAANVVPPMVA